MKPQRIRYTCRLCGKRHVIGSKISNAHFEKGWSVESELKKHIDRILKTKGMPYLIEKINSIMKAQRS